MKSKRLPTHLRHPLSRRTYRIPYVRTFAFLALIAILLALAVLGRAAPAITAGTTPSHACASNEVWSTASPTLAPAP